MTVISLELNELNMDAVRAYVARGELPEFARLIAEHGIAHTTSEQRYENIEPWIQWVTAHTGLEYDEHQIFRLGDVRGRGFDQIWEVLERKGVKVGAVSPMNAENRCEKPAFFVPDPWVQGPVTGPWALRQLYSAIVQAVNDNAQAKLTPASAAKLLVGLAAYARPHRLGDYLKLATAALNKKSWAKALVLDRLLADVFLTELRRSRPGFASLFLNAGAHIQHHYMFSSAVYDGPFQNPDWYVKPVDDPILDVYRLYDAIIADTRRAAPEARLIIATGLHQVPHEELTFYWRLKDHTSFLRAIGVTFDRVEPRMSRDFVVFCTDAAAALDAERRLGMITSMDNAPLFVVDNRGKDLFVTLTWPHDVTADFEYRFGNEVRRGLRDEIAFVAIKNGEHDGVGYVIDTGASGDGATYPLSQMPHRIAAACGVALAA